ncbi:MAG: hypothetical protein ACJA1E_002018 [Paracoccaceae bacterium]|jgi:hypothetical protein
MIVTLRTYDRPVQLRPHLGATIELQVITIPAEQACFNRPALHPVCARACGQSRVSKYLVAGDGHACSHYAVHRKMPTNAFLLLRHIFAKLLELFIAITTGAAR